MRRLLGSLERSLALLNAITDGITAQEKDGRLIYANDAAARSSGYPSGEAMLAAPVAEMAARFEILDEAGQPIDFSKLPGRLALKGQAVPEQVLLSRNRETGEERWSAIKAHPVFSETGEVEFVVNIIRDITAQKKKDILQQFLIEAGKTLASSLDYEETLAAVARLATPRIADWCAIDLVDEQHNIRRVAVAHIDPQKVEWAYELQRKYPPSLDRDTGFAKVIKTGESDYSPHITDEFLVAAAGEDKELLKIARELGFRSSVMVPLTARGRTFGAISLVTTSESGRYLTAEDVALAEELGRTAALAVDNARLYHQSQSSNRDLERFAYIASHDLQEPLRTVTSYMQLLEQRYSSLFDQDAHDFIGFAIDGAARMKMLISDLLAYSRLNTQEYKSASFSTERALKTALNDLKANIEESGAQIRIGALPVIKGNETQFVQLFENLLSNAIKFHRDNTPEVSVSARRDKQKWVFAVQDNGIGIDKKHAEQIFVMFKRLHTKEEYPGTGIGLAICQKIVEYHGGHIWVDSQPGQGTTFYFTIPADVS